MRGVRVDSRMGYRVLQVRCPPSRVTSIGQDSSSASASAARRPTSSGWLDYRITRIPGSSVAGVFTPTTHRRSHDQH